jgi:hypothetical protein
MPRDAGATFADAEELRDEVHAVRDGLNRDRYLDVLRADVERFLPEALGIFDAMRAYLRDRHWNGARSCARGIRAVSRKKRGAFVWASEAREIHGTRNRESARRRGWGR